MNKQKLLTLEQARTKLRLQGKTARKVAQDVAEWLEQKGITPDSPITRHTVNAFLSGHHQGQHGNAHWIAVYLGIKPECADAYIDMPLPKRTRQPKAAGSTPKRRQTDRAAAPSPTLPHAGEGV